MPENPFIPTTPATRPCPFCGARIPAVVPEAGGAASRCPQCAKELPKPDELSPRAAKLFGLGLIAIGALCSYWFCYEPWQKILAGEPTTLSLKGAAFGPVLFGLGCAFFLPNRPAAGVKEPLAVRLLRGILLALMLGGFVAGVVVYFWLRAFARAHGYDV